MWNCTGKQAVWGSKEQDTIITPKAMLVGAHVAGPGPKNAVQMPGGPSLDQRKSET